MSWDCPPYTLSSFIISLSKSHRCSAAVVVLSSLTYVNDLLFQLHLLIQFVIFFVSWILAFRGLGRRRSEKTAVARQIIDDPVRLERRRKRWPYYLLDPQRRAQQIGNLQNPLCVKDQRLGVLSRPVVLIRLCYAGVVASILLWLAVPFYGGDLLPWLCLGLLLPLALLILALSATSITREREEKTFELLRTSPLTSWQIVWSKYRVTLRFVWFLTLSMLSTSLVFLPLSLILTRHRPGTRWSDIDAFLSFGTIVKSLFFVMAFSTLYAALGIYCSTRCRRSLNAVVSAFFAALLLLVLPLLCYSFDKTFGDPDSNNYGWAGDEAFHLTASTHDILNNIYVQVGPIISPVDFFFMVQPVGAYPSYMQQEKLYSDTWGVCLLHAALVLGLSFFILWRASCRLAREGRK